MANLTVEDIANISFRKANIGGYRPEDVDNFIDSVQVSFDGLLKENAELKRKLGILAQKVEEYRGEEDSIRNTLLSAQKLADASVREAKHKAEVIVADATEKAERIIVGAQKEQEDQKGELKRIQDEVVAFRSNLLAIYKEHLQSISALPTEEDFKQEEEPQAAGEETPDTPNPAAAIGNTQAEAPAQEAVPAEQAAETPEQEPAAAPETKEDLEQTKVYEPVNYPASQLPTPAPMPAATEPQPLEDQLPARFASLQFGEDYDRKRDGEESPINNMFKKRK